MNLNKFGQASHRESLAYINKNVDMKDEKAAELAKAALKTANEFMKDMKSQGLVFQTERTDDKGTTKTVTASASVKVEKATEKQNVELPTGQTVQADVPKFNSRGDEIYNVSINIHKGNEKLQLTCSQYLDGDKAKITGMRWSEFNRANPKASPSAKGADEIAASNASSELKAIAAAADKGGYIKSFSNGITIDKELDRSDKRAVELANAMAAAMADVHKAMSDQGKLFDVTITKKDTGEEKTFPVSAYITVKPAIKDGKQRTNNDNVPLYFVQARYSKEKESLTLLGSNYPDKETGKTNIVGMVYNDFTGGAGNTVRISGNAEIQKSPAAPEIKALADAIEKGGFIKESSRSELKSLAYQLNTEVFKTTVMVEQKNPETGKMEDVKKKLLNASYNEPETRTGEDGREYTTDESITIFNKSTAVSGELGGVEIQNKDVLVSLTIDEKYGNTVRAFYTPVTNVIGEDGKPTGEVKAKESSEDRSAYSYINSAEDVADFLPDLPELHEAIAKFTGIDLEAIKDAVENAKGDGSPVVDEPADITIDNIDEFEEIGGIEDMPFDDIEDL